MDKQNPEAISKRTISLSARELEVLFLIAHEHTNFQIAEKLGLSKGTIDTYRNNILGKLFAKNTAGMVRIAVEKKILVLDNESKVILGTN